MSFFEGPRPAQGNEPAPSATQDTDASGTSSTLSAHSASNGAGLTPVSSSEPALSGVSSSGGELPSMTDIELLAASLDRIDQTLADLDQPRPTPIGTPR